MILDASEATLSPGNRNSTVVRILSTSGAVTQGIFFCNLQGNVVAGNVAEEIVRVTSLFRNLFRNKKSRFSFSLGML